MEYRDDRADLETRRDALRRELAELDDKAEALRAAVHDREGVERELADLEARLAERKGRRLPLLARIQIASPCSASWEAMKGDDRVRFCGECEKNVYNLSAMTRAEAEALLAAREGDVCVRLYERADGTVITSDCPEGVKRRRRRRVAIAVAGAGAMAATAAFAASAMRGPDAPHAVPTASAVAPPAPVVVECPTPTAQPSASATLPPPPVATQRPKGTPPPPVHKMGKPMHGLDF